MDSSEFRLFWRHAPAPSFAAQAARAAAATAEQADRNRAGRIWVRGAPGDGRARDEDLPLPRMRSRNTHWHGTCTGVAGRSRRGCVRGSTALAHAVLDESGYQRTHPKVVVRNW